MTLQDARQGGLWLSYGVPDASPVTIADHHPTVLSLTLSSVARVFERRPKLIIVAFTLTVLLAVGAMVVADLWWRREQVEKLAASRAGTLAYVLSEYVRGSFGSADAAMRQLAVHSRRVGGPTASREVWEPILASAKAALPETGSVSVTDASGVITHSTQRAIVGVSRREHYIFQQLAKNDRNELVVDRPLRPVSGQVPYILPIGRRLTSADGTFVGTVVTTLLPEAYRDFFRTIGVGPDGVISVIHPDGVVLFREPSTVDPINESAGDSPLLNAALKNGAGSLDSPLTPGGSDYISAYRTLASPPLIIAVSLGRNDALADWRRQRRVSAIAFSALTLTLGAVVMALFGVVDARTRAEKELQDVQQQEAERLRISNDRLAQALEREQQARRESEQASYMKDEFLMTVSHELRTPLTAIYGWVRVLATKEMTRAEQARALAAVERNAVSQTRLIDDLLDVSRAISGKLRLESRPVDLGMVVRAAAETLNPAMIGKGIHFTLSLDAHVATIPADPDRLQQIIWNLLSNAIKFTPDGGTVELRVSNPSDSHLEISVSDTGAGIPSDFLPFVFERFRQGDAGTRRRYGGLGLGLAIVRHLVELHGGTVAVESDGEGKGATFRVTLPVGSARSNAPHLHADQPHMERTIGRDRLDGTRILVVEDEPDARELFREILTAAGARVRVASSGGEALAALALDGVEVLISDIEMPNVDGYQLLKLVLDNGGLGHERLIAIAVTAYARETDRRRALEAGFQLHLAKPVDPGALVSSIADLVAQRT
jgi:signal transduction histidine kinase/ActR/RegA family two-component response regulator